MRSYRLTSVRFDEAARVPNWMSLIESMGQLGAWCADRSAANTWWSPGVYALFDVPPDLLFMPDMRDFFPAETTEKFERARQQATDFGTPWSIESPFVSAAGRQLWVRSTGAAGTVDGQQILFGCFQDLTEAHALRADGEANQQFLESILDNVPHMIFVKEAKDLRFVKFNKAGEQLLGLKSGDLVGHNDYDFFPPAQADFFVAKDRQTMRDRGTLEIPEEVIDTPVGRKFLNTRKITLVDAQGEPKYLLGISIDITEQRRQQETIAQQRAALTNAARLSALGEMAGGVAHEINNPLAIIRTMSEQISTILADPTPDLARVGMLAQRVKATVDRIAKIVSGLRDFSRDGGQDPMVGLPVARLVRETLDLCSEKFKIHGITVDSDGIDPGLELVCQPVRLSQVLINLLNNAYDALMAHKACEPRIVISAALNANRDRVQIRVRDFGPGIPPALADHVMLPFFTTKELGKGTGLGLSIAKGICESHGGKLELEPANPGACFIISLPHAESAAPEG